MPEFHAAEAAHQEWKQAVLTGALDLAEIDTDPHTVIGLQSTKWKPGMPVPVAGA